MSIFQLIAYGGDRDIYLSGDYDEPTYSEFYKKKKFKIIREREKEERRKKREERRKRKEERRKKKGGNRRIIKYLSGK